MISERKPKIMKHKDLSIGYYHAIITTNEVLTGIGLR